MSSRSEWIINRPMMDYLTLTSSSDNWYKASKSVLEKDFDIYGEVTRRSNFEQYRGDLYASGVLLSEGIQHDSRHYLLNMPGAISGDWIYSKSGSSVGGRDRIHIARATRVDLQITFAIVGIWDARFVSGKWQENGLNARLVEGGEKMDTIYVGSKKSNYFWRFYVKEDTVGNRYLRCEVQLKKGDGHSVNAWNSLLDGVSVSSIMGAYAPAEEKTITGDDESDAMMRKFFDSVKGGYEKPKRVVNDSFERWLTEQVSKAMINRMDMHDYNSFIREWLSQMVDAMGGDVQWESGNLPKNS